MALIKKGNLELTMEDGRLFIKPMGNNSVYVKMDVTPLWHFFQEVTAHSNASGSEATAPIKNLEK